jgi:hypothetical protein
MDPADLCPVRLAILNKKLEKNRITVYREIRWDG